MKIRESMLVGAAIWLVCDYAVDQWGTQPTVHLTFPDGECLGVTSPDPEHSCTNRPEVYTVKWINLEIKK